MPVRFLLQKNNLQALCAGCLPDIQNAVKIFFVCKKRTSDRDIFLKMQKICVFFGVRTEGRTYFFDRKCRKQKFRIQNYSKKSK